MDPAVRILFVCTANICRSPTAEHLARAVEGTAGRFEFASAGFLYDGTGCPDALVDVIGQRGTDVSAHRSRILDASVLRDADLVVTMEAAHLREITVLDPPSFAKTVPLVELERMLAAGPRALPDVLDELARRDPAAYLAVDTRDDVPDPYGGSGRAYREAVDTIDRLVRTVVTNLRPPPADAPGLPTRAAATATASSPSAGDPVRSGRRVPVAVLLGVVALAVVAAAVLLRSL